MSFSTSSTANSGSQRSTQFSRNVPRERPEPVCCPHGTSSACNRCSKVERASPLAVRKSIDSLLSRASGVNLVFFCCLARSSSKGASGRSAGTWPTSDPSNSFVSISRHGSNSPKLRHAIDASLSSSKPGARAVSQSCQASGQPYDLNRRCGRNSVPRLAH